MSKDPVCSLLGLASRGRNLVSGEFSTEKAIKEGRAYIVIVAKDASDNTRKKFSDMCSYRSIPIYFYQDKESLGKALGKELRASIAITDEGLSKAIVKKIDMLASSEGINESKRDS